MHRIAAVQYGFASTLRDALPNASFIGFTGTPIEQTDANTRAVFGWLCFEETGRGHRLRWPAALAPSDWEELSDIRLRQLLIMACGTKVTE